MTSPGQNPFDPALFVRPTPAQPPRRPSALRQRLTHYATVAGVFLLLVGCCAGIRFVTSEEDDDDKPRPAGATASPTYTYSPPPTSARPSPTYTYSPPAPATTAPAKPNLDNVQKGQCLKNNGTNDDPEMVPVPCGKGTYQVLARYPGYIDTVCMSVQGYTTSYTVTYYINGIPDSVRSYVLCLKKR